MFSSVLLLSINIVLLLQEDVMEVELFVVKHLDLLV